MYLYNKKETGRCGKNEKLKLGGLEVYIYIYRAETSDDYLPRYLKMPSYLVCLLFAISHARLHNAFCLSPPYQQRFS